MYIFPIDGKSSNSNKFGAPVLSQYISTLVTEPGNTEERLVMLTESLAQRVTKFPTVKSALGLLALTIKSWLMLLAQPPIPVTVKFTV